MLYLLTLYIAFLFLFGVFTLAGIYHLWRFGYVGDLTKPAIAIYLVLAIVIVAATFGLLFINSSLT